MRLKFKFNIHTLKSADGGFCRETPIYVILHLILLLYRLLLVGLEEQSFV